jgi:outer membrane protein
MGGSTLIGRLLATAGVFAVAAGFNSVSAQTIDDALIGAYRTNPQLLSSRAQLRALDEGVAQALSGWRPTVTLAGSIGKAHDITRTTNTATDQTSLAERLRTPDAASIIVSQPLYTGGQTVAGVSQAENNVQAGRATLQSVEQQVLLAAATAYANLLRDQATLELNINNEQVLSRQLEAVRDQFRVGEVTRTDVAQSEARLEQARATRTQAEGNLANSRATYERVVGLVAPSNVAPAHLPPNLPASADEVRNSVTNNPDLIAARFNEKAAADAVDVILGQKLPTVALTGTVQRNTETGAGVGRGIQSDSGSVALTLTMPLYQAGLTDAQARAAKQTAGQRRIDIETSRRSTIEAGVQNWDALNAARAQTQSLQAQVRAATIAHEGVQEEQRVGLRTVIEVLNAEQDLFVARVNLVSSQRDEVVFAYQLSQNVGRLNAAELALPVEIYDPTRHYGAERGRWFGTNIFDPSKPDSATDSNR